MAKRAVFLDRDGTINHDVGYLSDHRKLEFIGNSPEAINNLNKLGFEVIVVTNQSGIARGLIKEEQLEKIHDTLQAKLEEYGAHLTAIYFCPHHKEYGDKELKKDCDCRKPNPGMLKKAATELNLDLTQSYMIGDKIADIKAGHGAGCKSILVLTGEGQKTKENLTSVDKKPEYIAEDIYKAVEWIEQNEK